MELFGHDIVLLATGGRHELTYAESLELVEKVAAPLDETDALRFYNTSEDCVRFGRGYSHFTDGCWMRLPIGKELKNYSSISQTEYHTGKGYVNKFADKPTDFALFISKNLHLFTEENKEWGMCILSHLHQDVNSDTVWQHDLCVCDTNHNKVTYVASGKEVTGKEFREDMVLTNVYMHRMFVLYTEEIFGHPINGKEFLDAVFASLDKFYSEPMATNTKRYFQMDSRVWNASEGQMKELADEIIYTGLFKNRQHLDDTTKSLFEAAVASLNPIVNHKIRKNH